MSCTALASRAGRVVQGLRKSEPSLFVELGASHAFPDHSVTWKDIYVKNVPFPVRSYVRILFDWPSFETNVDLCDAKVGSPLNPMIFIRS